MRAQYPAPGRREHNTGVIIAGGRAGCIWASTSNDVNANFLGFHYGYIAPINVTYRTEGNQVRCLRE